MRLWIYLEVVRQVGASSHLSETKYIKTKTNDFSKLMENIKLFTAREVKCMLGVSSYFVS